jgi:hypothetical protein
MREKLTIIVRKEERKASRQDDGQFLRSQPATAAVLARQTWRGLAGTASQKRKKAEHAATESAAGEFYDADLGGTMARSHWFSVADVPCSPAKRIGFRLAENDSFSVPTSNPTSSSQTCACIDRCD